MEKGSGEKATWQKQYSQQPLELVGSFVFVANPPA
jgi:hypothetical protein